MLNKCRNAGVPYEQHQKKYGAVKLNKAGKTMSELY